MKLTLDLPSVAAGGALALLLAVIVGLAPQAAQQPPASDRTPVPRTEPARAHPRDFIWLESIGKTASPVFKVPKGKILVVTAVSSDHPGNRAFININGTIRTFSLGYVAGTERSLTNAARGFDIGVPLPAGSTVQVRGKSINGNVAGFVWLHGYLSGE